MRQSEAPSISGACFLIGADPRSSVCMRAHVGRRRRRRQRPRRPRRVTTACSGRGFWGVAFMPPHVNGRASFPHADGEKHRLLGDAAEGRAVRALPWQALLEVQGPRRMVEWTMCRGTSGRVVTPSIGGAPFWRRSGGFDWCRRPRWRRCRKPHKMTIGFDWSTAKFGTLSRL